MKTLQMDINNKLTNVGLHAKQIEGEVARLNTQTKHERKHTTQQLSIFTYYL